MEEMSCWNLDSLQKFGVELLTSEACKLNMRILCDVNQQGKDLVLRYFGLPDSTSLERPWNSRVDRLPTIGSIMLARDTLWHLLRFALRERFAYVYECRDGVLYGRNTPMQNAEHANIVHTWRGLGAVGDDRNVHQMSGRTR